MPKPNKTTATTDRPENGPNAIEVALTKLFSDADQGRRTRLIAALKPFTAVFAEAGFTAGGGWRAKSLKGYADASAKYDLPTHVPKAQRAAYMSHVLQQARDTNPTITDRYSRGPSIPTVEYIGLYTKADERLSVKIGRNLLREGVFVRLDATETVRPSWSMEPAKNNFLEASLSMMGQRRVESSVPSCQKQGVATPEIVSLIGTFLAAVKSPAAGVYDAAIKTLADRAKAEEEAKQARLQAQAEAERRRLYGGSFFNRHW